MNRTLRTKFQSLSHKVVRVFAQFFGHIEEEHPVCARVYYTFDHGSWRARDTRQLRREHRCKQ